MLNAKLDRHLAKPHVLSHEISTFIYIIIYIDDFMWLKVHMDGFINRHLVGWKNFLPNRFGSIVFLFYF